MSQAVALSKEIDAIRRMGEFTFDGVRVAPIAFGPRLGIKPADRFGPNFLFTIYPTEGLLGLCMLGLEIDAYGATDPESETSAFNVDRWEAKKLYLNAPASRDGFRELSRVARALLGGREVRLHYMNGYFTGTLATLQWVQQWTRDIKPDVISREIQS